MEDALKQLEKDLKEIKDKITLIEQRRTGQQMILPDAVKMRHVGEGVRYVRSGLEADKPTEGEEPLQGAATYFSTDIDTLWIWNGDSWVEFNNLFTGWVIFSGVAADRPSGATQVKAYFATDTSTLSLWNGSSWITYIAPNVITASGVYTPTKSAETNVSVTMTEAQYMRVGATVTVSGRFTADPTAAVATSFEITLPVASNLGAAEDAAGVAFSGAIAGQGADIIGVAANDTAKVQWIAVDITSQLWAYTFTYQVI